VGLPKAGSGTTIGLSKQSKAGDQQGEKANPDCVKKETMSPLLEEGARGQRRNQQRKDIENATDEHR